MTPTEYRSIRLASEAGTTTLTLARPQVRNALDHAMMVEIERAITMIGSDPDIRVLVIRGEGGHFCAGGDLNAMANPPAASANGDDPTLDMYRRYGDVLEAIDRLPFAVVSVVEGTCVGGGAGMAAASDFVLASDQSRFGLPEPRHGFIPSQVIPSLVRRIGLAATRRIAVTAQVIDAAEALRLGLADAVVPETEMDAALARLLLQLRRNAPRAVAAVKALVQMAGDRSSGEVLDQGARSLMALLRGPEAKEGIAAFLAKRRPDWDA
ncbi:MAG: enoyl-CoA hydratase/isomerase family protein [Burkholderiales bacterium]